MQFNFPQLVAHVSKTRELVAGSIIGSGTISNHDRSVGSCCLAEQRMIEIIDTGAAVTPFMKLGDSVRIEMKDTAGHSIFGAIEQTVVPHG
jgi:fumarylacetoacetate (FAA) hydrolase